MTERGWPTCKGYICSGIRVTGFLQCLAHLKPEELSQFCERLCPGTDLDLRGTTISEELLTWIRDAVQDEDGNHVFGQARFEYTVFTGYGLFTDVIFEDTASFYNAEFRRPLSLVRVKAHNEIRLVNAKFDKRVWLEFVSARHLNLDRARFSATLEVLSDADRVTCNLARFEDGANIRLLSSTINAEQAVFGAASSVTGVGETSMPRLESVRGTDVSNLVLTDVDLRQCEFTGAHRLDQLKFAGHCLFNCPPRSWRWARRRTIAEEHTWRGWSTDKVAKTSPERLAATYRSLRKAFEDSKNEAGAGDFYYGEMEMRRHSPATPRTEKLILALYWLLSGYGQRAVRAVAALGVLVAVVCGLLFTVGLSGQVVWTWDRIDQSLRIGMGAVVFREAGQTLTSAGSWTVMVARFAGPVLLALAVLAIRARVKR